jgi:uncharacterized membrane protein
VRYLAIVFKVLGLIGFLVPLTYCLGGIVYIYWSGGANSQGGAAFGAVLLLIAMVTLPVALAVLLLGFFLSWLARLAKDVDAERAAAAKQKSEGQ